MKALLLAVCLLVTTACRKTDAPAPPSPTPSAVPSASSSAVTARAAQPRLLEETQVAGLRVRSGTLSASPSWGFSELAVELGQVGL